MLPSVLRNAVSAIRGGGGTALFAATVEAVEMLRLEEGRRAIILLTDGVDTEGDPSVDTTIKRAVESELPIYTIGLGSTSSVDVITLRELADQTNGRAFLTPSAAELSNVYSLISQQISNEFVFNYISPHAVDDGTKRIVEVQVDLGSGPVTGSKSYTVAGVIPPTRISGWGLGSWLLFGGSLLVFVSLMVPQGVPALIRNVERRFTGISGLR